MGDKSWFRRAKDAAQEIQDYAQENSISLATGKTVSKELSDGKKFLRQVSKITEARKIAEASKIPRIEHQRASFFTFQQFNFFQWRTKIENNNSKIENNTIPENENCMAPVAQKVADSLVAIGKLSHNANTLVERWLLPGIEIFSRMASAILKFGEVYCFFDSFVHISENVLLIYGHLELFAGEIGRPWHGPSKFYLNFRLILSLKEQYPEILKPYLNTLYGRLLQMGGVLLYSVKYVFDSGKILFGLDKNPVSLFENPWSSLTLYSFLFMLSGEILLRRTAIVQAVPHTGTIRLLFLLGRAIATPTAASSSGNLPAPAYFPPILEQSSEPSNLVIAPIVESIT